MLTISPGSSASVGMRLDRRRQHQQPARGVLARRSVRTSSMSPYWTAAAASSTVFCGGRPSITETSPNCRSPSTSTTGFGRALRHRGRDVDRDRQVLPTPPLVENTDDRGDPGSPVGGVRRRRRARRVAGAGEQLTDPVDRLVRGSPRRRSRPRRGHRRAAPAAGPRSTARRPRTPRPARGASS